MTEDRYGSVYRERRKQIMSEPAQSTAEKFRTLNRRERDVKHLDIASKWILALVLVFLIVIIGAQFVIYMGHHYGYR